MYSTFLILHSLNRYVVLALLIVLVVKSLMGWQGKAAFGPVDNKISLFTLIFTHVQLLLGFIVYFVSPFVKFGAGMMSDKATRYWSVEHITIMLIAIVLITVGRSSSKKLTDGTAKHKRLFVFNAIALFLILAGIFMSGRGFFG